MIELGIFFINFSSIFRIRKQSPIGDRRYILFSYKKFQPSKTLRKENDRDYKVL